MNRLAVCIALVAITSCTEKRTTSTPSADTRQQMTQIQQVDVTTSREFAAKHGTFESYWFRGLAELNRYELQQSRYGELHDGEAVFIFVTEPFLTDKQVKHEHGDDANAIQVLKLNNHRRFNTGIYPYSVLTSTFTPAKRDGPTIKLTQSVQEWCGQVFAQANLKPDAGGYGVVSYSYFQSEGDKAFDLATTLLEDELFTRVRLGPEKLPTGTIQLLPSATFLRLLHKPWDVVEATATLGEPAKTEFSDALVRTYELRYPTYDRTLRIHFEEAFPHRIVGWEDTHPAIFNREGGQPELLTTKAKLTKSIMLDYWNRNSVADTPYRDALDLQF